MEEALGSRFAAVREHFAKTQRAMSAEFGLSPQAWGFYESGRNSPGFATLEALARRGIDIHWLVSGQGSMLVATSSTQPRVVAEVQNHMLDRLGLGRMALMAGRGTVDVRMRILTHLHHKKPACLSMSQLASDLDLKESVIAFHLEQLVTEGVVSERLESGCAGYACLNEAAFTRLSAKSDVAQAGIEAIEALALQILPAAAEAHQPTTVMKSVVTLPKGKGVEFLRKIKAWVKDCEPTKGEDCDSVMVVFGGTVLPGQ